MYNKYTQEHSPIEEALAELKYAWREAREEIQSSNTIEELEEIIMDAPLYSIWESLLGSCPLIRFESMRDIISAFRLAVKDEIELLESYCY